MLRQTALRGRSLPSPPIDGGKMVGSADWLNPSRFLSSQNPGGSPVSRSASHDGSNLTGHRYREARCPPVCFPPRHSRCIFYVCIIWCCPITRQAEACKHTLQSPGEVVNWTDFWDLSGQRSGGALRCVCATTFPASSRFWIPDWSSDVSQCFTGITGTGRGSRCERVFV